MRILELFFPKCCGICGKLNKFFICNACYSQMKNKINVKEENHKGFYNKHYYFFKYKDIRKLIMKYKFNGKSYLYNTFCEIIVKNKKKCSFFENYDIIISVPIHWKRKIIRGYNQSELIAKKIGKIYHIEYDNNILKKIKNIKPQSTLNRLERLNNVNDVYEMINFEKVKNKNVLIVDDIYTTGSTVRECAKVLKRAGVNQIGIFTLAKG